MEYVRSTGNQAVRRNLDTAMERANNKAAALRKRIAEAEAELAARHEAEQKTAASLAALKRAPGARNNLMSMVKGR